MKKFYSLLIAMTLVFSVSCFLQDDDDEAVPVGEGTLNVTVTYDDDSSTIKFGDSSGGTLGTEQLFVYLYEARPTNYRTPARKYFGSTADNGGTVTITGITAGNYYILVFYDYYGASSGTPSNPDNQNDPYELYNNTNDPSSAITYSINGGTNTLSITLNDQWQLLGSGAYEI